MFIDFRKKRRKWQNKREEHQCEKESSIGCLLYVPDWGSNVQPMFLPWQGFEPKTFCCMGWQSNQLRPLLQVSQSHFYICRKNDFTMMKWPNIHKNILNLLSVYTFYLFIYLFIYFRMKGKGGRKRRREKSVCGCLLRTPNGDLVTTPDMSPRLGIELVTIWSTSCQSILWDTPARAKCISFQIIPLLLHLGQLTLNIIS